MSRTSSSAAATHILSRMFTDHNRPFYKSAVTILLDKPPMDESVRFVIERAI